jgi:hypothetical protein
LEEMIAKPEIVPKTTLFRKVVAYECSACGKSFPVPLLEGAVSPHLPIPLIIYAAFLAHDCKSSTGQKRKIRESRMAADDDDLPTTYLLYAIAVILVIAAAAASTFFIIFH